MKKIISPNGCRIEVESVTQLSLKRIAGAKDDRIITADSPQ
ncbi:MAG: hypothetical protein ABI666_04400 [Ferruginibacter sp.]